MCYFLNPQYGQDSLLKLKWQKMLYARANNEWLAFFLSSFLVCIEMITVKLNDLLGLYEPNPSVPFEYNVRKYEWGT